MSKFALNWAKRVKEGYDKGYYTVDDVYYFYERKRAGRCIKGNVRYLRKG